VDDNINDISCHIYSYDIIGKLVFSDHIFSDDPYMVAIAHQLAMTRNCRS
jgi:hypothetical protein